MALPAQRKSSPRRVVRDPRVLGGEPTLEGTRIPVRTVVEATRFIGNADDIVDAYPMLDRESVECALAFYHENRLEIERYIAENQDAPS